MGQSDIRSHVTQDLGDTNLFKDIYFADLITDHVLLLIISLKMHALNNDQTFN